MFWSFVFPGRLHDIVFRENAGNFVAALFGILFSLPFRNSISPDILSAFAGVTQNNFLSAKSIPFASTIAFIFLPVLTLIFLAYTVFGRHIIPAVFFFSAFFRSFLTCVFLRAFGNAGLLYAIALFGLPDLVLLPGLCITACLSVELSSSVAKSCRGGGRIDLRKYSRMFFCGLVFPVSAALVSYISVSLFSAFLN